MSISTVNMGLSEQDMQTILSFIARYPEIELVKVFGSRAIGKYRKGSDIDLVLYGKEVTEKTAADLKFDIEEESYLPYFLDVLSYNHIRVSSLIKHIDRYGIELPVYPIAMEST